MSWNTKYAILLFISTVVTYISGLVIERIRKTGTPKAQSVSKIVVAASCVINLGILFAFKYLDFFEVLLTKICNLIHIPFVVPQFDIILPVGISFYTFQALSYTIDVYRGETDCEHNFFRYALFVSFFPQLVAGPIERSKNLLVQLKNGISFNFERARDGFLLMLWGYFLKIVLADRISIIVDTVYNSYEYYSGWFLIVATILFAIQIYCDFAGYSTIAIGAAKILGVDLMQNFDAPYTSISVAEFWKRWHISLTSWFRDYVYIPMGGNRKGRIRTQVNRISVFLLSGLWHGADLSYVAWGGINGLYLVIGDVLAPLRRKIVSVLRLDPKLLGFKIYRVLITFALVDIAWIFFRADSISTANSIIGSIFTADNPWILFDGSLYELGVDGANFRLMIICIIVLLAVDILNRLNISVRNIITRQDYLFRWIIISFSIVFILTFGIWGPGYNAKNFIYFQF